MNRSRTLLLAATTALLACSASGFGAALITAATGDLVNPDPNDAFNGATVNGDSVTWFLGHTEPGQGEQKSSDMFGTVTSWHTRPGMTRFGGKGNAAVWDGSSSTLAPGNELNLDPHFVNFSTAAPVSIGGVRVTSTAAPITGHNGTVAHHSWVRFRLYGSTDNGLTFSDLLSDVVLIDIPTIPSGQTTGFDWNSPTFMSTYGSTDIVITDFFDAPATYQYFRAEFHVTNRNPNDFTIGEIDALPVPEPTALAGLALGGAVTLLRRRRA